MELTLQQVISVWGMDFWIPALITAVIAYFCGCFNGAVIVSKYLRDPPGNILIGQNSCPDGIVNVMVDIGDLITAANDLSFQGPGPLVTCMAQNSVPNLPGQI